MDQIALSTDAVEVLEALRRPGESLSDVVLRLVERAETPRLELEDDESAVC